MARIKGVNAVRRYVLNAIVENKAVPVGMVIESGPGLIPEFLKCGKANVFVSGYIDHIGREVQRLILMKCRKHLSFFSVKV